MSTLFPRLIASLALGLWALAAHAFPDHAVTIVVPTTPGSLTDIVARVLSPRLSQLWAQPVIVENRPGAGALVGTQYAMKQKPDGHTLLLGTMELATMQALNKHAQIDVLGGLDAVGKIGSLPMVLLSTPQFPGNGYRGAVAAIKAAPEKYSYASNGNGSVMQLYAEMFKRDAGLQLLHVPYRGGPEASRALLAGEVDFEVQVVNANVLGYLDSGKARALAVGSATRLKSMPDVPTTAEVGLPQLPMEVWYGLFAPAGLPRDTLARIHTDLSTALGSPEVRSRLTEVGLTVQPESTAAFADFFHAEYRRWTRLVEETGIQAN